VHRKGNIEHSRLKGWVVDQYGTEAIDEGRNVHVRAFKYPRESAVQYFLLWDGGSCHFEAGLYHFNETQQIPVPAAVSARVCSPPCDDKEKQKQIRCFIHEALTAMFAKQHDDLLGVRISYDGYKHYAIPDTDITHEDVINETVKTESEKVLIAAQRYGDEWGSPIKTEMFVLQWNGLAIPFQAQHDYLDTPPNSPWPGIWTITDFGTGYRIDHGKTCALLNKDRFYEYIAQDKVTRLHKFNETQQEIAEIYSEFGLYSSSSPMQLSLSDMHLVTPPVFWEYGTYKFSSRAHEQQALNLAKAALREYQTYYGLGQGPIKDIFVAKDALQYGPSFFGISESKAGPACSFVNDRSEPVTKDEGNDSSLYRVGGYINEKLHFSILYAYDDSKAGEASANGNDAWKPSTDMRQERPK